MSHPLPEHRHSAPTFEDLAAALLDPSCDAVELTRLALVLARARSEAFDLASRTDATIVVGDDAQRRFVARLSGRDVTIDLSPDARAELHAILRARRSERSPRSATASRRWSRTCSRSRSGRFSAPASSISSPRAAPGCSARTTFLISAVRESRDYERITQSKLVPFRMPYDDGEIVEDIRRPGQEITLLSGPRCSLLVAICMDFIDQELSRLSHDLRPSLVLVPACTPTTGVFASTARDLAMRSQAHVVVVNQRAPGKGDPAAALIARPRREDEDGLDSVPAEGMVTPALRSTRLSEGAWRPD